MRISDWSSDVCSSDLLHRLVDGRCADIECAAEDVGEAQCVVDLVRIIRTAGGDDAIGTRLARGIGADLGRGIGQCENDRSEEHTSELQSLMRISYAVFCLTQKKRDNPVGRQRMYKM